MGKETVLFKNEEKKSLGEVTGFLRELADKLDSNKVVFIHGNQTVKVKVPSTVELEIKVKKKPESEKPRRRLRLRLNGLQKLRMEKAMVQLNSDKVFLNENYYTKAAGSNG